MPVVITARLKRNLKICIVQHYHVFKGGHLFSRLVCDLLNVDRPISSIEAIGCEQGLRIRVCQSSDDRPDSKPREEG